MKRYLNLSINRQLAIIVIVLVIGFAAIGFSYNRVLNVEESTATKVQDTIQYQALAEKARLDLFVAQGLGKDFQITNRLEKLEGFDTTMAKGLEAVAILSAQAPTQDMQDLVARLTESYASYQSAVYEIAEAKLAIGLDAHSGLLGDLSDTSDEIQTLISENRNARIAASFQEMRANEMDYLLLEQQGLAQKMADEHTAFKSAVNKSSLKNATKSELISYVDQYYAMFEELVESINSRNLADENAQKIASELAPEFDRLITLAGETVISNRLAADEENRVITITFISTLLGIFALIAGMLLLFSRKIGRSLGRLQHAVSQVGEGDFEVRTNLTTGDELGVLGRAFDNMLADRLTQLSSTAEENEQLNNSVVNLMEAVSQLSENDLTVRVPVNEDVTGPVADAINLMAEETSRVLSQINEVAHVVGETAVAVRNQGEEVAEESAKERQVVDETMVQLESAAETMLQVAKLAKRVNEVAIDASKSTETAVEAVDSTSNGMNDIRETISETEKRIKRLGERSQEISSVVDIINNIAERTHVLALNASMQAAAAGEAGRGFAVVADEVQRLAESSRSSTSQIGALVNNIQTETAETMTTMNKAIDKVVNVSEIARVAGEEMKQTQTRAHELTQSVQQIAKSSIDQVKVSKDIRAQAKKIQDSTKATHEALSVQSTHTKKLVGYGQQLLKTVSIFTLPTFAEGANDPTIFTQAESEENIVAIRSAEQQ